MEFKNEALGLRFVIPDFISVEQQLEFTSESVSSRGRDLLKNIWSASKLLITEWECQYLPDISTNLKTIGSPKAHDVITWVCLEVRNYMQRLDDVPKN
jgi:hypothetical protein